MAIRVGPAPPSSTELIASAILTYGRHLVAAPDYLKKRGTPRRPEALAKHDALMSFQGTTDTWTLHHGELEARIRPRTVFRSNALHALRDLSIGGAGIALLPVWFVRKEIAARQLSRILPDWGAGNGDRLRHLPSRPARRAPREGAHRAPARRAPRHVTPGRPEPGEARPSRPRS